MTAQPSSTIGVVGAGAMGRGIIQLFAQSGHRVLAFDAAPGAAVGAIATVTQTFDQLVAKGRLAAQAREEAVSRMVAVTALEELGPCDVVIEAIIEDLAIKRDLFRALEGIVAEGAILASNTSSLTVSEIAGACARPGRIAGLHFFNPAPLMKVVEVIAAVRTAPDVVESLRSLVVSTGHRAVVAADQPGFLVNHAGRGLYTEGLRIVEEQSAAPHEVDLILREALGFRMGPFELMDLTGLDVSGKVMASIYEQFQQEPRYRPSSLVPPRIAGGLYGRKTGEGWYRYEGGKQVVLPSAPAPALPGAITVWIDPEAVDRVALTQLVTGAGARVAGEMQHADLMFIQPWGLDATAAAVAGGLDATCCVAVDPMPGLGRRRTLMLTAVTTPQARDAAHALLSADGVGASVINDGPGFVTQRVLATIVNTAANIAQRGIATVADIEDSVKLGLGYPHGPLGWGDLIGGGRILAILRAMYQGTGDPRYRPSPWLVRRASLGLPLVTPEAAR